MIFYLLYYDNHTKTILIIGQTVNQSKEILKNIINSDIEISLLKCVDFNSTFNQIIDLKLNSFFFKNKLNLLPSATISV